MAAPWVILHGGALGDLALTIQLALRLPGVIEQGRLELLSRIDPGDLSAFRPLVSRRSLDGLASHQLYATDAAPLAGPLTDWLQGRRVLSALGDRESVVHRTLASVAREVHSFDPRPRPGLATHITSQWQADLGDLLARDMLVRDSCLEPSSLRDSRPATAAACKTAPILIHPGSGSRDKCWSFDGFLAVGRTLARDIRPVAFILGPVEIERWTPDAISHVRDEFPFERVREPSRLVELLAGAALLIGNDAGPSHLAALLGTPTLTIFGPTRAEAWKPLGSRARAIQGDPSGGHTSWGVSPEEVTSSAREIVDFLRPEESPHSGQRPETLPVRS